MCPFFARTLLRSTACLAILAASLAPVRAGRPLREYDISLRFPAATSRFASYGDVAALGGAQAASIWSSSNNPASAAWPHPELKSTNSFSPQFTDVRFGESTDLCVIAEALTLDAGAWGVFLPSAAQITSNHAQDSQGVGFRFDADFVQMQWGKQIGKETAIGASFSVTVSETRSDVDDEQVARSKDQGYGVRLGLVHRCLPRLTVGAFVDYGFSRSRTDSLEFDVPTFRFRTVRMRDITDQFVCHVGVSWEYATGSNIYLDYQGGVFTNDTGTLTVHRFPIGVEHMVVKDILFARIGATFDTRGEVTLSAGLGLSLAAWATLDLAYQHNALPDIRYEFGEAQTFVLSVGIAL